MRKEFEETQEELEGLRTKCRIDKKIIGKGKAKLEKICETLNVVQTTKVRQGKEKQ